MRNIIILLLIILAGCATYREQIPRTTMLPITDSELLKFYDNNIEGINCLADFISPQRKIIGIGIKPSSERLEIMSIFEGSPAEAAGLRVGDIITKVNGKPINNTYSFDSSSDIEIKRGDKIFTLRIAPTFMKSNFAIETKITATELKGEKYITEIIDTGVVLNSVQFKTNYERSRWMVSNWAVPFWKLNAPCLPDKVRTDNILLRIVYGHKNFVTERYHKGYDEILDIYSKKSDIINFVNGDISVQELLDKSMVFINYSREKLFMQ